MVKKSAKKEKSITTDELAIMVQKGFVALDNKIDSLGTELRSDIKKLEENIEDSMERHIKVVHHDYGALAYRVKKLEHKVFEKR